MRGARAFENELDCENRNSNDVIGTKGTNSFAKEAEEADEECDEVEIECERKPDRVKTMSRSEDESSDFVDFSRALTRKESHVLAKGTSRYVPRSGCYVHRCVKCAGTPIGCSYNYFSKESMCFVINSYPFGCCSLPLQRNLHEYASVKNDIKVIIVDKTTNTIACHSHAHCCYCQPMFSS